MKYFDSHVNYFSPTSSLVDGHINFEKFWQLAKQVTEFIAWKQVTCPFHKEVKVIQYLMTGPVYDEHGKR